MAIQLTTSGNIKISFSEPKENVVNDFEYRRINIQTKYSDVGPLIIPLKNCYSFGLQKNAKFEGYTFPITANDEFAKVFKSASDKCKKHIVKVANKIGMEEMELSDLKLCSCFYKREDKPPILYKKVIYDSHNDEIVTKLYAKEKIDATDEFGILSDPLKYLGKRCNVNLPLNLKVYLLEIIILEMEVY